MKKYGWIIGNVITIIVLMITYSYTSGQQNEYVKNTENKTTACEKRIDEISKKQEDLFKEQVQSNKEIMSAISKIASDISALKAEMVYLRKTSAY